MYDRYVDNAGKHLRQFCPGMTEVGRRMAVRKMSQQVAQQGTGRYCKGDVHRMGVEDLQSLSNFLGVKLYLMGGDNPTELDSVLFGFMSVILYTFPDDSVFKIVVEKRLGNLLQHTKRMKANFYPDWDDIVGQPSLTTIRPVDNDDANKCEESKSTPSRPPPPSLNSLSPAKNMGTSQKTIGTSILEQSNVKVLQQTAAKPAKTEAPPVSSAGPQVKPTNQVKGRESPKPQPKAAPVKQTIAPPPGGATAQRPAQQPQRQNSSGSFNAQAQKKLKALFK